MLLVILPLELCGLTIAAPAGSIVAKLLAVIMVGMAVFAARQIYVNKGRPEIYLAVGAVALVIIFFLSIQYGWDQVDVFGQLTIAAKDILHGMTPYIKDSPLLIVNPDLSNYVRITYIAYGPGAVLLSVPGYLLGDVRMSDLLALVVTWAGIALLYRKQKGEKWWVGRTLLALSVMSPLSLLMLRLTWVDCLSMMCLVLWLVLRESNISILRVIAVISLGMFLEVKVTDFIMVFAFFLFSKQMRKEIAFGVGAAVLIVVPFMIWSGPITILRAVVGGPVGWGIRTDGWSVPALVYSLFHVLLPSNLTLFVAILPFAFLAVVPPLNGSDAVVGTVFVVLIFYVLGKVAFPDYYFDVVILCIVGPCIAESLDSKQSYNLTERGSARESRVTSHSVQVT